MKHATLTKLWVEQREKYKKRNEGLFETARALRDEVEKILDPIEKTWSEPSIEEPNQFKNIKYIDIVDISKSELTELNFFELPINQFGELILGVCITFDHKIKAYPKTRYNIPVAIRFNNSQPEFAFYDTNTMRSETKWECDIIKFSLDLINTLKDYLSFNPFMGFPKKSSIGFVNIDGLSSISSFY
jgi:hypothetical protein